MADLFDSFLQAFALQEAQKAAIANASPYAGLESGANTINQAIMGAAGNPQYSTGEKIAAGLVGGLLGGGAQYLNEDWQSRAQKEYRDAVGAGFAGKKMNRDLLPQSVFDTGTEAGQMFRARSVFDQAQNTREVENEMDLYQRKKDADFDMERRKLELEKPWLKGMQNPAATRADAGEDTTMAMPVEAGGALTDEQRVMEGLRTGRFESPAEGYKALRTEQKDRNQGELAFQDQFMSLPVVKDFTYKRRGLDAFMQALQDPAGTSDYELVRRAAQAVEPGLAVRKDDTDAIEGSTSLFGGLGAKIKNQLQGESRLSDDVRAGLARIVKRSYEADLPKYNATREKFLKAAEARNYDPGFAVPYDRGVPFQELFPDAAIEPTEPTIEEQLARGYSTGGMQGALKELAKQYPNTPEGRAQFKAAVPQVQQLFGGR